MADSYSEFTVSGIETEDEIQEIKEGLEKLEGFQIAEFDAETGRVEVGYTEELLWEEKIKSAIRDLGYEVE
jgi:copper chaperone CopZ